MIINNNNNLNSVVHCNLTKSAISKIINLSSSKYNTMKKREVVSQIYNGMLNGGIWRLSWKDDYSLKYETRDIEPLMGKMRIEYLDTEAEYSSGSYCECSSMTTYGLYKVNFRYKTITDVDNNVTYYF